MTNLHEAPDVSATLSESDLSIRRFRGSSYEEALAAAQAELGDNIRVIGADRIRRGGLGGFFATDLGVEVAVAPVASDTRTTANSLSWGPDDARGDLADQVVSDLDWDELTRRVEADDQRNRRRASRRVGVEQLLDDAERSDRSLSSWARDDLDDLDVPSFLKPLPTEPELSDDDESSFGDSFFGIDIEPEIDALVVDEPEIIEDVVEELEALIDDEVDEGWFEGIDAAPDALADDDWLDQFIDHGDASKAPSCESARLETASPRRRRIVDGGDGGARLLDDALAVFESPTEHIPPSAPIVEAVPVVEIVPVIEAVPVVEIVPVIEAVPVVEIAPVIETPPVVEIARVRPTVVVHADPVSAQPDTVFEAIADYEPVGSPLPAPKLSVPAPPAPKLSVPAPPAPKPSVPAPPAPALSVQALSVPAPCVPVVAAAALSAPALPAPSLALLPVPVASVRATVPVAQVVDGSAANDAATMIEVVAHDNTMAMPEVTLVESTELSLSDPLRRPTELATIAAGRLAMRLAELPPFNGGLLAETYRVNVAVTTPDGTRIEMSTEVDGAGD